MSASKSTCSLDPIPTILLKSVLPDLLNVITKITNESLSSGIFPCELKTALVKPVLKKASLDCNVFKNYRPVSNIPFLSKVIEKAVSQRLITYLSENNLLEEFQSAYKVKHSTETALLEVQNQILTSLDRGDGVFLALLDLSAAFDTVEHAILLRFMEMSLGVCGTVLNWFSSYLSERTQQVSIENTVSESGSVLYGVPQGSVLGPIIFCVYILPLGKIIQNHGLKYHIYADDTQLLCPFPIHDPFPVLNKLELCVADIRAWMLKNQLKVNDDKTEFLVIASKSKQQHLPDSLSLQVGTSTVTASESARNLGVVFDKEMDMNAQVSSVCRSVHFHLRKISSIRHLLTTAATEKLVHSLISSRLDYCSVLLTGLPSYRVRRLQAAQNSAARVVSKTKKYDHITPVLQSLHWLPVEHRITFKLLLITFKILRDQAPAYLKVLLSLHVPGRSLRSANQQLLSVPVTHLKTYGDRTFAYAAAHMWNSLPLTIKSSSDVESFKSCLKTHLFKIAYCDT